MSRHQLSKADLLQYALSGAVTERGLWSGAMNPEQADMLDNDITEIERRIKLVKLAEQRNAALAERNKQRMDSTKAAAVVQIAEKLGLPVIDMNLLPLEPGDI